tara:strand:+ start:998 stop:1717 length:720 start_codon:yes stop_codon:yes gene_type:complete
MAVVPARGGSKGVHKKNIKPIMGIPIVGIAGKILNLIDEIDYKIVSTDDNEIASIANEYGLDSPFIRPKNLSGDRVGDIPVLEHALKWIIKEKKETIDVILMIQPTSPMRKIKHIRECLKKQIIGNYDSVITVSESDLKYHPFKQLIIENENLKWFDESIGDEIVSRQDLSPVYHKNGACYAINSEFLINCDKQATPIGLNTSYIITESMISIDNEEDFIMTENKIKKKYSSIEEYIQS